jgi:hypothetical protein
MGNAARQLHTGMVTRYHRLKRRGAVGRSGTSRLKAQGSGGVAPLLAPLAPPLPARKFCKLRYVAAYNSVSASTTAVERWYRLNSIFDPDGTGVGHQPLYHDQLANIYQAYRVHGAKVIVNISNASVSANIQTHIAFFPVRDDLTTPSSIDQAVEQWRCRSVILPTDGTSVTFAQYYDCAKIQQVSKLRYKSSDDFMAGMGANPTRDTNWHMLVQSRDQSSSVTVNYTIEIIYYVELFGLVMPSTS